MKNKTIAVFTPSQGRCPSLMDEPPLKAVDRVLIFVLSDDVGFRTDENTAQTLEYKYISSINAYYNALNRSLHPYVEMQYDILFASPGHKLSDSMIGDLKALLADDPLCGFALPRKAYRTGITNYGEKIHGLLPDRIYGEIVSGTPVLVSHTVLYHFGRIEGGTYDLSDALAKLFIRSNRRGFCATIANSVLLGMNEDDHPIPDDNGFPQIESARDYYKAIGQISNTPERRLESLLSHRFRPKKQNRILFDIRNLAPGYNGTSELVLNLIREISRLSDDFEFVPSFWVLPESAEFHSLERIIPDQCIFQLTDNDIFDASIRLTQPWSFTELKDQAYRSTINIYFMLDAIAYDCFYIRMPHLDGVWRALSEFADGFIYLSNFTKRTFTQRFPSSCDARSTVAYCSLNPSDYIANRESGGNGNRASSPYIFVIGNQYYHKGLYEVLPCISTAFPETPIKVLGEISLTLPNVEMLPSGLIDESTIADLFRECKCLVFPSYYEGFGIPILKAIAYHKPVIVRKSELVDEIASQIKPINGIIQFERNTDLLRSIDRALSTSGQCTDFEFSADAIEIPYGWSQSAIAILELVDNCLKSTDLERCKKRLDFFYKVDQFDVERKGWTDADQNKIIFETEIQE